MHAIGVNPVETYFRAGTFGEYKLPHILGMDCGGEVESVGSDVKMFKVFELCLEKRSTYIFG